jgi:predicted NACHT family NTPase/DNA-binding Xre family transcriptional regulator
MAGNFRSLKLSPDGKRQVDRALTGKAWGNDELMEAVGVQIATVKNFRAGKAVDRKNFVKFCQALELDWEQVAESESPPVNSSGGAAPVERTAENSQRNLDKAQGGKVREHLIPFRKKSKANELGKKALIFLRDRVKYSRKVQGSETTMIQWKIYRVALIQCGIHFLSLDEILTELILELLRIKIIRWKIYLIALDRSNLKSLNELNEIIQAIKSQSRARILNQYSEIRLLSGERIVVDKLYVDVWLLNRQLSTFHISESKMLKSFDLRNDRVGLGDRIQRNPGFEIANQETKLLILGKPGAGKTTFLKHLAIDWCNGKFQPDLVTIFIEFRQVRDDEWNCLDVIGEELGIYNREQVEVLLNSGNLLILMDGFDEISTERLRRNIHRQLKEITRNYPRNRFIMTCRTQIEESVLDGFTVVEVADFNEQQVEYFVLNWFRANSSNDLETVHYWDICRRSIIRNPALKELTVTPVLLSLICLVLQDEGEIPGQVNSLYRRGVNLLLRKWNDAKVIDSWEMGTATYRRLTVEEKEDLLIRIAARKFENPNNFTLFEEEDLLLQITHLLHLPGRSEGKSILKAIESQHGLLVERADGLWSFSHLTFQEYFTTKWLLSLSSKELSQKIGDKRWQEVVKQLVKAQGQSDRLLRLIKQAIDYSLDYDSRVQELLVWTFKKDRSIYISSAIRAFYFAFVVDLSLVYAIDLDRSFALARNIDPTLNDAISDALKYAIDRKCHSTCELNLDLDLILAIAHDHALDGALTSITVDSIKLAHSFTRALARGCALDRALAHDLAPEFKKILEQLRSKFSKANSYEQWWQLNGPTWRGELRQSMVKYRDIGHDWQLTDVQTQKLQLYYDANKFLVELLKIENSASPEARQEIEDNLLLPIAELKRRLPDQYGGMEEG